VDNRTGIQVADRDHITIKLYGGPGRKKSHIYLQGHGTGVTAYNQMSVLAECVLSGKGKSYSLDESLCTGEWRLVIPASVAEGSSMFSLATATSTITDA
jgi:hypothetical protein